VASVARVEFVVTLDCLDTEAMAGFWETALAPLAYRRCLDAPPYLSLVSEQGPTLLLQRVPEPKSVKNRMHLDLGVQDLQAEVDRIGRLGARTVATDLTEHGFRWAVLADPEGNEFCVFVKPEG
jgi:predicted enzyme related to lactoylglutathione lyase